MTGGNRPVPAKIRYRDLPALGEVDLGRSDWMTIAQDRIDRFADAVGDHQWIHVDVARSRAEIGYTIAHGQLVYALIPLLRQDVYAIIDQGRTINYGSDKVRFISPVPAGSRVRLHSRLMHAETRGDGVQASFEHTIELELAAKPACIAQVICLYLP